MGEEIGVAGNSVRPERDRHRLATSPAIGRSGAGGRCTRWID
jgi:hypothetical protein